MTRPLTVKARAVLPSHAPLLPGGMPSVWLSYACAPCRLAIAKGGSEWADENCPGCGQPMERLGKHQMADRERPS